VGAPAIVFAGRPAHLVSVRTADPLARSLFAISRSLPEEAQLAILDALHARLAGTDSARVALTREAIARFGDETGEPLAKHRYERWRLALDDRAAVPSATYIAGTFGSWSKAVAALGCQPAIEHVAQRLHALGPKMSDQTVLADVRQCAADLGHAPKHGEYYAWARERLSTDNSRRAFLLAPQSFATRFGSWRATLIRAGLDPAAASCRGPHGRLENYTRAEMLRCMLEADASDCKTQRWLTIGAYDRWRARCLAASAASGATDLVIPSAKTIAVRLGSWTSALVTAHLMSDENRVLTHRGPARAFPAEVIEVALRDARTQLGPGFSQIRYIRWREQMIANDVMATIPAAPTLRGHYGSWADIHAVVERVACDG
jgi:hypothetical protein